MKWPDGRQYIGNFTNDQRSGSGLLSWANGSFYDGNFSYGLRHGYGVMVYIHGMDYRSYMAIICRRIQDVKRDPRCRRYEGQWSLDQR